MPDIILFKYKTVTKIVKFQKKKCNLKHQSIKSIKLILLEVQILQFFLFVSNTII